MLSVARRPSIEVRHSAPGEAHLEWSVHKELRKDVRVTVD